MKKIFELPKNEERERRELVIKIADWLEQHPEIENCHLIIETVERIS